ncbi:MAG: hypothetical protein HY886_10205 [Deltaproteobacteria bacterium]|nr:hypothetical protein [Deltaproteobacteria bacterium]
MAHKRFFDNSGEGRLRVLFWICLLAAAVYAGYKFAPPLVAYHLFKTEVQDEAKLAHMYGDEKLLVRIMDKARGWDIPIGSDDIKINRYKDEIFISVHYSVTLDFPGGYSKELFYGIDARAPLKDTTSIAH